MANTPVTTVTSTKTAILHKHDTDGLTWEQISQIYEIPKSTLHAFATGRRCLPLKWYGRLGLEMPDATVTVVSGEIPHGAQALGAMRCECGMPFISNHPRRRRCFICSPHRGKDRR